MMKKLLLVLALLAPSAAWAQCNGQFSNGQVCGVASGGPKLPGPVAMSAFGTISGVTPTRAGDVIYWNGSAWVTLAGNNSGTNMLTENASGVPSWAAFTSGTVTSATIAPGSGITATGTCTITTTGTCTIASVLGITGTPSANQVAQWTNATTIQGVNEASLLTAGTGISITGTTNATIAIAHPTASNVLGGDVALNNTANYFDGPSMAQGTSGTWYASGTVTLADTGSNGVIQCKLWDGTTVIASSRTYISTISTPNTLSLSGILASPAANIRISCKDTINTTGKIVFNATGESKDSSIYGVRIQ